MPVIRGARVNGRPAASAYGERLRSVRGVPRRLGVAYGFPLLSARAMLLSSAGSAWPAGDAKGRPANDETLPPVSVHSRY